MEQHELLKFVCELLARLDVAYMVTGSQASTAYGEPRFTNDIDIVADLNAASLEAFCDEFPPADFYLSRSTARQALAERGMFNVIHPTSGLKIDVIIPQSDGADHRRLLRAQSVTIADGVAVLMTTPEDIIVKKLEWRLMGGGERHLRDIVGILKIRGDRLDIPSIEQSARELGAEEVWHELRRVAASRA